MIWILNISYFREGNILSSEYYKNNPIAILVDSTSRKIPHNVLFKCIVIDSEQFSLEPYEIDGFDFDLKGRVYRFGDTLDIDGFRLAVVKNTNNVTGREVVFKINSVEAVTNYYRKSLKVDPLERESSILKISIEGANIKKEIDFLNSLIARYIANGLEEKNVNATNTINFIDDQLASISDSLSMIELRLALFKKDNSEVYLDKSSSTYFDLLQDLDRRRAEILVQKEYLIYLKDYLEKGDYTNEIVVPNYLNISDPILNKLLIDFLDIQTKIKLLRLNENNPIYKDSYIQLNELKFNLLKSIDNINKSNELNMNNIDDQSRQILDDLRNLPEVERELVNIQRLYNLSETLYVFLLEKRAEAGITKSSNTSDIKLIDAAMVEGRPVKPQPLKNYTIAGFLGVVIPSLLIILLDYFDNRIRSKEDIFRLTPIPLLGYIGHSKIKSDLVIDRNPKSAISESFRTIRSNLRYMTNNGKTSEIVLITSSISGEGKTFCAKNLAYVFSITGERVVLLNTDMRKPTSNREFEIHSSVGLSNYLAGLVGVDDVVNKTNQENLDLIVAGDVPPNPSELILSPKFSQLIDELRERYDYIIIDTPPIGILSDGLELMKYSDINIFMIRQDYSLKGYLNNFK